MSYPNQKHITIIKTESGKENTYSVINQLALRLAMTKLKNSSFKLWAYLASNQNNYKFWLSQTDCNFWGIGKDSYYDAVRQLIDTGYLVQQERKNEYVFYELPPQFNRGIID